MENNIEDVNLSRHGTRNLNGMNTDKQIRIDKPCAIYVQNNSCLEELSDVKIVWSNFRNCYKLIQDEEELNLSEQK